MATDYSLQGVYFPTYSPLYFPIPDVLRPTVLVMVCEENRMLIVPAEDRVTIVSLENRIMTTESEVDGSCQ